MITTYNHYLIPNYKSNAWRYI